MAQLAIKGHATRGSEVIELLEMLGGKNLRGISATNEKLFVTIGDDDVIIGTFPTDEIGFFTLEEFLRKYPYKVGDKVSYKTDNTTYFISKIRWVHNKVLYDLNDYSDRCGTSHSLMFDVEAEKLQPYKEKTTGKGIIYDEIDFNRCPCADKVQLILGNDFEIKEEDGKTFVVRKKNQYPKTYEECCKVMGIDSDNYLSVRNRYYDDGEEDTTDYEQDSLGIFDSLWELKICRDAYWKIAGEQMGLGKPWEPDWNVDTGKVKYVILYRNNSIVKDAVVCINTILAFPTEEMRDAFYENFKDLIGKCKTLL